MSGVEVGVALSNVDRGGGQRAADLDTRCGELYASGGEVLPAGQADSEDAAGEGGAAAAWAIRPGPLRLLVAGTSSSRS